MNSLAWARRERCGFAGTFGGDADRTCKVPLGKAIFFPIANYVGWYGSDGSTKEEMRAAANAVVDGFKVVKCKIDGMPVHNLRAYRVETEAFFLSVPVGSLLDEWEAVEPPGIEPAVADGYWLLLVLLSAGRHTIRFRNDFSEIIYHITMTKK